MRIMRVWIMRPLLKDYSFGIIPLRLVDGRWQTFIVQQTNSYWSFPKGHAEHQETPKQTAERELFEETGLTVKTYFDLEPLSATYTSHNNFTEPYEKTVTLFCATVQGIILLCPVETIQGMWIDIADLQRKIVFDSMQPLVKKLQAIVREL